MNRKLCAPADKAQSWESIDWKKAEAYVKKLQMRIVKAQKGGHYNKVKSLQWLLTHSFYAKALAVKRVTSNKGNYMLLFVNNPCFYIGSTKINSCSVHFFLTQSVMILIILTLSIYWFQRKKSNSNFKNTRHDRLLIFHRDCMILIDAHMLCLFHRINLFYCHIRPVPVRCVICRYREKCACFLLPASSPDRQIKCSGFRTFLCGCFHSVCHP